MTRPTISVWDAPWLDGVAIRFDVMEGGKRWIAAPIVMNPAPPPGESCEASAIIDKSAAQKLMDDLWSIGLRPTEGTGSAGALKATEKHLQDMRQLVFGEKLKP